MTENNPHDDGGAAYPKPCDECSHAVDAHGQSGMTLLDHFAGLAMQIITGNIDGWSEDAVARASYKQAEAMVAEKRRREKG